MLLYHFIKSESYLYVFFIILFPEITVNFSPKLLKRKFFEYVSILSIHLMRNLILCVYHSCIEFKNVMTVGFATFPPKSSSELFLPITQ